MNNSNNLQTAFKTIKYSIYIVLIVILIFFIRSCLSGKFIQQPVDISSFKEPANTMLIDSFLLYQKKNQLDETLRILKDFKRHFDKGITVSDTTLNTYIQCLNNAQFETIQNYLRKIGFYDIFPVGDNYTFYPEMLSGIPDKAIEIMINKYKNHLTRVDYLFSTTDAEALSILEGINKKP